MEHLNDGLWENADFPPRLGELHSIRTSRAGGSGSPTARDAEGLEAVAVVRDLIRCVRVIQTAKSEPVGLAIAADVAALLT
jgi:hypothetical protein